MERVGDGGRGREREWGGRRVGSQHLFNNFLCEFLGTNLHWICASECLYIVAGEPDFLSCVIYSLLI
jgi:hypothetical protein